MKTLFQATARWLFVLLLAVSLNPIRTVAAPIDDLQRSFLNPPDEARIMMRWWWFGPAVTKDELEREMRLMKEGGIGGFEVQPVYPLVLDDPSKGFKTLPFLSDDFIDALRFTSQKARELGLRFDLTLGSGWPFGGPMVRIEHAAARLRYEHVKIDPKSSFVKVPSIGAGEKLLAVFLAQAKGTNFEPDSVRELTEIKDGIVKLPSIPNSDPHEILFFVASRTGMQVKRPAVGGEGFVLDHMNRAATEMYLKSVGDRLMQAFGADPPYAIFCDSLEVYNSDWSYDFLEEFQKRRGYDLKPHLPALVNDMGAKTQGLRRDWGKTLTELLNERFLAPMQEWSRRNRTLFRIQDYGVPAANIGSNAFADLPDGEGAQWKVVRAARWASSASHLYGRPVATSETWTWLHSPSFRATPLDIKAEADIHFLQGITQLIGHGWPYTAPGIEYPGWRFYAAGVFNEKNPWWIVMPDLARYLQRASFLLRQGRPANDVAVYLPNDDGWAHFTPGNPHLIEILRERVGPELLPAIFEAGYNLDFFDEDAFKQIGKLDQGALVLGQNKYSIIILPNVEHISPEMYKKFEDFARSGGVLVATRRMPAESPGFLATIADHQQVAEMSKRLFEGPSAPGNFVANEKTDLGSTLNRRRVADVAIKPSSPDIGFLHRSTSEAEVYFLANTGNQRRQFKATFRVKGLMPESWNLFDGSVAPLKVESETKDGSVIALDLDSYASQVIVFAKRKLPWPQSSPSLSPAVPIDLSNGWRVSTATNEAWPTMEKLRSWTEDESTRYFSGVATYEKEISVPQAMLKKGLRVRLDLGEGQPIAPQPMRNGMRAWLDAPVRDAAVVYVNNKRAGSVWCAPYSIDVTSWLQAGQNRIRIQVANTAINYMAGHSLPDYRLLNLRYGERFQPQDMDKVQPVPSGLMGPIRLISEVKQ